MKETIKVEYLWPSLDTTELKCDITKYMDKYVKYKTNYSQSYLYNDLIEISNNSLFKIVFRYPGASRGCIYLKRIDTYKFEVIGFGFNKEMCFSDSNGCYNEKLEDEIDTYIGSILDFEGVYLLNNRGIE